MSSVFKLQPNQTHLKHIHTHKQSLHTYTHENKFDITDFLIMFIPEMPFCKPPKISIFITSLSTKPTKFYGLFGSFSLVRVSSPSTEKEKKKQETSHPFHPIFISFFNSFFPTHIHLHTHILNLYLSLSLSLSHLSSTYFISFFIFLIILISFPKWVFKKVRSDE